MRCGRLAQTRQASLLQARRVRAGRDGRGGVHVGWRHGLQGSPRVHPAGARQRWRRRRRGHQQRAGAGHRRGVPVELSPADARHQRTAVPARRRRDARLQQGGRQHVPEPGARAHRAVGGRAAGPVLARRTGVLRRVPVRVARFPGRRLRHGVRRGCARHRRVPLRQGRVRRQTGRPLSAAAHVARRADGGPSPPRQRDGVFRAPAGHRLRAGLRAQDRAVHGRPPVHGRVLVVHAHARLRRVPAVRRRPPERLLGRAQPVRAAGPHGRGADERPRYPVGPVPGHGPGRSRGPVADAPADRTGPVPARVSPGRAQPARQRRPADHAVRPARNAAGPGRPGAAEERRRRRPRRQPVPGGAREPVVPDGRRAGALLRVPRPPYRGARGRRRRGGRGHRAGAPPQRRAVGVPAVRQPDAERRPPGGRGDAARRRQPATGPVLRDHGVHGAGARQVRGDGQQARPPVPDRGLGQPAQRIRQPKRLRQRFAGQVAVLLRALGTRSSGNFNVPGANYTHGRVRTYGRTGDERTKTVFGRHVFNRRCFLTIYFDRPAVDVAV